MMLGCDGLRGHDFSVRTGTDLLVVDVYINLQILQGVPPEGRGKGGKKVLAVPVQSPSLHSCHLQPLMTCECNRHSHPPTVLHGSSALQGDYIGGRFAL